MRIEFPTVISEFNIFSISLKYDYLRMMGITEISNLMSSYVLIPLKISIINMYSNN